MPDNGGGIPELRKFSYHGSGVVIKNTKSNSLVITNNHVCASPDTFEIDKKEYDVLGYMIGIIALNGNVSPAKIIRKDSIKDLCLLKVKGIVGTPAIIGLNLPQQGEPIVYVGSPARAFEIGSMFVGDGRYLGIAYRPKGIKLLFLSCPVSPGASGSGVYHNGKLIGLVVQMNVDFKNVTFAIPSYDIYSFLSVGTIEK
jgi:S1-C subfamily serine protease